MSLETIALQLDRDDPLAAFRQQFALPLAPDGTPALYLCGHSLGLMPLAAPAMVQQELDDWARLGVRGHHEARRDWIGYAERLNAPLARLAGAREDEVVAMNSLSVNLHLLMASFYRPAGARRCIVIEAGAFPSDRHAVASQIHWHGLDARDALIELAPAPGEEDCDEAQLEELLARRGAEVALVLWPGVQYRSGRAFDLARIAAAARRAGARCGFDLAHAIGNLPLSLHDAGADFAAWCTYKYLNAGPGALAAAFVHSSHRRADLPGLAAGGDTTPRRAFAWDLNSCLQPARQDGRSATHRSCPRHRCWPRCRCSTRQAMEALRRKSLRMTDLLLEQLDRHFAGRVQRVTPREHARRGNQLSLRLTAGRDAGRRAFEALGRSGVVADWREPDVLRVGFAPLYNSYSDVSRFVDALGRALESP